MKNKSFLEAMQEQIQREHRRQHRAARRKIIQSIRYYWPIIAFMIGFAASMAVIIYIIASTTPKL